MTEGRDGREVGVGIPMRDHQETAASERGGAFGGGGGSTTFMEATTKGTKGPSGLSHSHHHHWPPIEEFIYGDPGRKGMLKQRYN